MICRNPLGSKHDREGSVQFDTFLEPLLQDLRSLATEGFAAFEFDRATQKMIPFRLKGHLLIVTGDMPYSSRSFVLGY